MRELPLVIFYLRDTLLIIIPLTRRYVCYAIYRVLFQKHNELDSREWHAQVLPVSRVVALGILLTAFRIIVLYHSLCSSPLLCLHALPISDNIHEILQSILAGTALTWLSDVLQKIIRTYMLLLWTFYNIDEWYVDEQQQILDLHNNLCIYYIDEYKWTTTTNLQPHFIYVAYSQHDGICTYSRMHTKLYIYMLTLFIVLWYYTMYMHFHHAYGVLLEGGLLLHNQQEFGI